MAAGVVVAGREGGEGDVGRWGGLAVEVRAPAARGAVGEQARADRAVADARRDLVGLRRERHRQDADCQLAVRSSGQPRLATGHPVPWLWGQHDRPGVGRWHQP